MTAETIVTISNQKGLHARASAQFVKTVTAYDAQVIVQHLTDDGDMGESPLPEPAEGDSILSLLMLAAGYGQRLHIRAEGPQAENCIEALQALIASGFGEEE